MRELSNWLTDAIVWIYDTLGFVGTGIFGAVYSPIVLTGLHQSFPAIETQLVSAFANGKGSGDFIFVVASMANVAQGAATTAVYFLTKDSKMKGLSSSSAVSALLGITEPAIFGVNLKLKFPFFCALVGSCVASTLAGLFHVIAASMGSAGFIGFISIYPKSIPFYLICELISFAIAFVITFLYGKSHMQLVDGDVVAAADDTAATVAAAEDETTTPAAPAAGAEILIHAGIDTVNLDGEHMESFVEQGQKVKKGDKLGTVDLDAVKAAGYDTTVMVILTNTANYQAVSRDADGQVEHGDDLFTAAK